MQRPHPKDSQRQAKIEIVRRRGGGGTIRVTSPGKGAIIEKETNPRRALRKQVDQMLDELSPGRFPKRTLE
jgi:hypothetical protein